MRLKRYSWLLFSLSLGCVGDDVGTGSTSDNTSDTMAPGGGGSQSANLFFLRPTPGSITEYSASFWAVKGESRTLHMSYAPTETGQPGAPLLVFEVDGNALLSKPNGGLFMPGDSVLITVQLDPVHLSFDFQPSGLLFNPLSPARLTVSHLHTDPDIDADGDLDATDVLLALGLGIWKQEFPGLPWLPLPTLRLDEHTLRANVRSFTGFATASN